jgi:hypothetical protein
VAHDGVMSAMQPERPDEQGPAGPPQIRIGTKEREAAYAALNAHLEAGRLDSDEYGERYGLASVARTRADLDVLFIDLPEPHSFPAPVAPQPSWVPSPAGNGPSWRAVRRLSPVLLGVLPFVAVALAITTHVWLFFLLIPATMSILGRRGWSGRGPRGRGYRRGFGGGYSGPGW